jgi:hypothetical protein
MKRTITMISVLALAMSLMALPALAMTASTPVSDGGVTPFIIDGANPGGNRTCAEVGLAFFDDASYYQFSSGRLNQEGAGGGTVGPITWSTDGTYVSWNGTHGGLAVIVKGGADANVYVYDGSDSSDSGLASPPVGAQQGPADLSNITFCWNPADAPEFEGCTPGFWRNDTRPANRAWAKTGYERSTVVFGGASLQQHLDTTGGLLNQLNFHTAAALLNAAHPDIDYPYSTQQILDWYADTTSATPSEDAYSIEELKDLFDAANNLGSDVC